MRSLAGTALLFVVVSLASGQTSPTAVSEHFVPVGSGKLYYEECGMGPSAVVLVHDGVVDSAVWDEVWPALCKQFHAIRYDRRGYGHSPAATEPYYEVDDLAVLLRDRHIVHAALVASSHGGEIALNFTLRYPAEVSALVLVGPSADGFPYSKQFLTRNLELVKPPMAKDRIDAFVRDPYLIAPDDDTARKRLHDLLVAAPQDVMHDDMPLPEQATLPRAHEIDVPTLILVGSADITDVQAIAGALVVAIPGAIRVVVSDTGHLMYLEKPDEFLRQVEGFLSLHEF